ncbi:GNAT family N-acetyltransferase [Butyrivibrio sp. DSM 10294]|uniref:GNAT family N-acetyltransferase n=1 Tax=Butyrivibrio sp. DSM 10294 TaxID=2972457 RepID=UPI00234EEF2C|nr:GNAT family N-acetyltransferase [Butyrivibrio sp. DSM 10294]MDC7295418.1 GNAT family N-acetyltransferase [Butyrivibrio sp. DSM 10294]
MLRKIMKYSDLDERKLMDIYSESNYDNTEYFYPDEKDKEKAVKLVETNFCDFLKNDFFKREDSVYWIYEENGEWLSALRTCMVQRDVYYLEALETRPDHRRNGYGALLLSNVVEELKKAGPFRLCDCVSKKNIASLKTHEKCDFQIASEEGYDYLSKETDNRYFGLEYRYLGE